MDVSPSVGCVVLKHGAAGMIGVHSPAGKINVVIGNKSATVICNNNNSTHNFTVNK